MSVLRVSTQLHKWVALVVGLQVLFWVGGGLVMTAIPIETVRSEHHVRKSEPAALSPDVAGSLPAVMRTVEGGLAKVELKTTPRGPAWVLTPVSGQVRVVSAVTGRPFGAMTPDEASRLAAGAYVGEGRPVSAAPLAVAPQEVGREGPIWRVDFSDKERTTFYVSPDTGEVVTRRSAVWRFYDFFWRLHVMDWDDGEDFNHPLIIITTALTLSIVLTGFVLLWIRLARDLKTARANRLSRDRP